MDLLPGLAEDAAVARVRPLVDAHLGAQHWSLRLRTGAALSRDVVGALVDALPDPTAVTEGAVVVAELGRALAPLEVLAAAIAGTHRPDVAFALPDAGTATVVLGPADAGLLVVAGDGIAFGTATGPPAVVDCIDPTTPMARVDLDVVERAGPEIGSRVDLLAAAYLAGLARGAQDLAVDHARTRVQFDRPIGANQAVQHALADCATRTEAAWAAVLYAATAVAEARVDHVFWCAVAARTALDAVDRNARAAVQLHGGRGYTLECPAHLFLVRGRLLARVLGGPARLRDRLLRHEPER